MALPARSILATSDIFDCHKELNDFYEAHVRLGKDRRATLAKHRDTNLERLSAGLKSLGPIEGSEDYDFDEYLIQGSYAMHTQNQHPDNDYDIDTGIIFLPEDIPDDAKAARARVASALRTAGGGFTRAPVARTNAVTVWYTRSQSATC